MDEFDASWLRLREPYDHAARDNAELAFLAPSLGKDVRIFDLGSGSGSNLRYLARRLGARQSWTLIDKDPRLLTIARKYQDDDQCVSQLTMERVDLAQDLNALTFETADLVTGSAFMDLVSEAWLKAFVSKVSATPVHGVLFALNVDGRVRWGSEDPFDDVVASLFERHMRNDKGFGPALGYEGWRRLSDILADAGFDVRTYDCPWRLGPEDREIQGALLDGYVGAAVETAPELEAEIGSWRDRRSGMIERGQSALMVGHRDVCAIRD